MKQKNNYQVGQIISEPSAEDLRPTPEQIAEQKRWSDLENRSLKCDWVVGEPYPWRPLPFLD